jgi:hypothetical protein
VITPAIAVNRVKNTPSCGVSETEAVKQPKGVKQTIVEWRLKAPLNDL